MKQRFFLTLLGLVFFASCQKELSTENGLGSTPTSTQNDSTLLSKYIEIDTSATAPFDTLSKGLYTYDNLKRLIKYDYVYYTNGVVTVPLDLHFYNYYFYIANDTLPYLEIDSANEQGNITTETKYHIYSNGKLISDSVPFGLGSSLVYKYYYLPSKTIDSIIQYSTTSPFISSYGYQAFYRQQSNNNIVSNKDSTFLADHSTTPMNYNLFTVNNYVFTYDNFNNSLNKFNYLDPYFFDGYFVHLNGFEGLSKNNILDFTHIRIGLMNNLNEHTISRYEYKSNGYPKIVRTFDVNNPSNFIKGLYFYTN